MQEGVTRLQGMQSGCNGMGEYGGQGKVTLAETFGCTHGTPSETFCALWAKLDKNRIKEFGKGDVAEALLLLLSSNL